MNKLLQFRLYLTQRNSYQIFFTVCVVTTCLVVLVYHATSWRNLVQVSSVKSKAILPQLLLRLNKQVQRSCPNVLTNMVTGRWIQREFAQSELEDVRRYHRVAREEHFLPYNLERRDKRCGNITFANLHAGNVHPLLWFRALCDADGDTPCCYNNRCVARKVEQCVCDTCYDMRQRVHAELATWTPSEPSCQMQTFKRVEDLCQLLRGRTIYFIGDSLVRHLYLALLQLLRANTEFESLLNKRLPAGKRKTCNEYTVYLSVCSIAFHRETRECNSTVKLKFVEYLGVAQSQEILKALEELRNVSKAMFVFGIGVHNNFDAESIISMVLLPVSRAVSTMAEPRPSLLWSSIHAPGLLKTPRYPAQSRESMLIYNAKIREILEREGIPEFNTFNVTDGMVSYDGLHYGKGVNHIKAQIFLNYLLESQRKNNKGNGS